MQIRRGAVGDAEALERIRVRGWQVGYRHIFPPEKLDAMPIEWARWEESLERPNPGYACLVAEDERGVVGFATIGPSHDPENRFGELHGLYVHPDFWGEGAGRALLTRAEIELAQTWDDAVLWTLADNPRTRRFYEAAGWRFDGQTSVFERLGVKAPIVHYGKRLSSSTSRS